MKLQTIQVTSIVIIVKILILITLYVALIKQFIEAGKLVAAICASPTLLGHAGYLKGKNYTCFTSMNEDFGGIYHEDYAVTDGNIITGKSAAATFDFAFAILEKLAGKETVEKVKKEIYYKNK